MNSAKPDDGFRAGASVCLSYMDPVADRLYSAHVAAVGNRAFSHLEMGILMGRISGQRGTLLLGDDDAAGPAKDPGTLFVKTVKTTSLDAAYDSPSSMRPGEP